MMKRVILSTNLLIGSGTFQAEEITQKQAQNWLAIGPAENFCVHETVKILGVEPAKSRRQCGSYDEALAITAKSRLEFGREYSVQEIQTIGVEFTLIRRVPTIQEIIDIAAKLPAGLNDPKSLEKLNNEFDELLQAIESGDEIAIYLEAGDAGAYYTAKVLDFVAHLSNLSVDDVLCCSIAKMTLRARPGNPKDDVAERDAVKTMLASRFANKAMQRE